MPMVIVTAQVQDPVKWEAGFRTHGDLFRKTYSLRSVHFTITGNEVVICMEPENLTSFRVMAVANTRASQFGNAQSEFMVSYMGPFRGAFKDRSAGAGSAGDHPFRLSFGIQQQTFYSFTGPGKTTTVLPIVHFSFF